MPAIILMYPFRNEMLFLCAEMYFLPRNLIDSIDCSFPVLRSIYHLIFQIISFPMTQDEFSVQFLHLQHTLLLRHAVSTVITRLLPVLSDEYRISNRYSESTKALPSRRRSLHAPLSIYVSLYLPSAALSASSTPF